MSAALFVAGRLFREQEAREMKSETIGLEEYKRLVERHPHLVPEGEMLMMARQIVW